MRRQIVVEIRRIITRRRVSVVLFIIWFFLRRGRISRVRHIDNAARQKQKA